jgi:peptide/nickel transport system ATP-binding protein
MGATEKIFNNPLHPYTKMLMASVPRLDKKCEDAKVELNASRSEVSGGCVYYGRCPIGDIACTKGRPPLLETDKDHFVACIRYK